MSIRVECEKCGSVLKIKEDLAGTKGKCPKCKHTLVIPELPPRTEGVPVTPAGEVAESSEASPRETSTPAPASIPLSVAAPSTPPPPALPSADPEPSAPASKPASAASDRKAPALQEPSPTDSTPVEPAMETNGSRAKAPSAPGTQGNGGTKPAAAKTSEKVRAGKEASAREASPKAAAEKEEENGAPKGEKDTDHDMPAVKADKKTPPPPPKKSSSDDEFDPAAFLMEGPKPKPKPIPPSPPASPVTGPKRSGLTPRRPAAERLEMSDEDDDTQTPGPGDTVTPTPRPINRSAADMAGSLLSGTASATSAKDLLARSAQESRARSSQMPLETKEPRTDYGALGKELFRSFGWQILGTIALCGVLFWISSRMFGDAIEIPDLAPVSGKVTLGGKPLPNVQVCFMVIGEKTGAYFKKDPDRTVRTSTAVTRDDGSYTLMYLPQENIKGAVIGKNRIWIEPINLEDYKTVPPQFQRPNSSGIIRDVKPSGGTIDVQL